jgi:hypothetical protein
MYKYLGILFFSLLLLASCDKDNYDTGDGELSYLRADFVEAHTSAASQVTYAITDDGDTIDFNPYISSKWALTADTLYRALLYYSRADDGTVTPMNLSRITVLRAASTNRPDTVKTDPVKFESAWLSTNRHYLNIGMSLMTGTSDGIDAKQIIGMFCTSVIEKSDGTNEYRLLLYHSQNGVPEYYSSRTYISVPISSLKTGDVVRISVYSYNGLMDKAFVI